MSAYNFVPGGQKFTKFFFVERWKDGSR